jgi:hypothetical protein
MNPLFMGEKLRGTIGANPVIMDKPQLDVLRMLVQGYDENHQPRWLEQMLKQITPRSRPVGEFQRGAMGIRG